MRSQAALVVSLFLVSFATAEPVNPDLKSQELPDFRELAPDEAEIVGDALVRERQDVVAKLQRQLEHPESTPEQRAWPAFLLGVYRASEAAPALVRHIDLHVEIKRTGLRPPSWFEHPAAEALVRIGRPASRAVLSALPDEPSEVRRQLMVQVIREVEGDELSAYLLEQQLKHARTDDQKARLLEAIQSLPKARE